MSQLYVFGGLADLAACTSLTYSLISRLSSSLWRKTWKVIMFLIVSGFNAEKTTTEYLCGLEVSDLFNWRSFAFRVQNVLVWFPRKIFYHKISQSLQWHISLGECTTWILTSFHSQSAENHSWENHSPSVRAAGFLAFVQVKPEKMQTEDISECSVTAASLHSCFKMKNASRPLIPRCRTVEWCQYSHTFIDTTATSSTFIGQHHLLGHSCTPEQMVQCKWFKNTVI